MPFVFLKQMLNGTGTSDKYRLINRKAVAEM